MFGHAISMCLLHMFSGIVKGLPKWLVCTIAMASPGLALAGNWQIFITVNGTSTVSTTSSGLLAPMYGASVQVYTYFTAGTTQSWSGASGGTTFTLSTTSMQSPPNNSVPVVGGTNKATLFMTATAGAGMDITGQAGQGITNLAFNDKITHNSQGGRVMVTMQWVPDHGDPVADPPPAQVIIMSGCELYADATGQTNTKAGGSVSGSANITFNANIGTYAGSGSAQANFSAASPFGQGSGTDTEPPNSGVGVSILNVPPSGLVTFYDNFQFQLTAPMTLQWQWLQPSDENTGVSAGLQYVVEVANDDLTLMGSGSSMPGVDFDPFGLGGGKSSDPTFTRWLPMEFSPHVSSAPFRTAAGALPAPWGNMNCAYSLALKPDPNFDIFGYGLVIDPNGNVYGNTGGLVPAAAIIDASGNKLSFFANNVPEADIMGDFSQLVNGGYQLANAGPPDNLKKRGHYTYVFGPLASGVAPLLSITDPQGNMQTLAYGINGNYLTVTDSSSGRQMWFKTGTGGYISEVDAPNSALTASAIRSVLSFDGGGHMTSLGPLIEIGSCRRR